MTTQQAAESGQLIACTLPASNGGVSSGMHPVIAAPITAGYRKGVAVNDGKKGSPQNLILQAHHPRNCPDDALIVASPVTASNGHHGHSSPRGDGADNLIAFTLKSAHRGIDNAWQYSYPHDENGVRRLMPVECLRLQAFPDDWLDLDPPLSDSAKYRLIGNAVTKNVAAWLGRRLVLVLAERV